MFLLVYAVLGVFTAHHRDDTALIHSFCSSHDGLGGTLFVQNFTAASDRFTYNYEAADPLECHDEYLLYLVE